MSVLVFEEGTGAFSLGRKIYGRAKNLDQGPGLLRLVEHASKLVYAQPFQLSEPDLFTPIGINCRLCPRQSCSQRAHQPVHLELPIDEHRRGETRFES